MVITGEHIVYTSGYGVANLENGVAISSSTVFNLGSTSKQFTAISIALLAQRGKLSFDDPVKKYLPELSAVYEGIRIRHLIYHTSGIRDYFDLLVLAGRDFNEIRFDDEIIRLLTQQRRLNFAPGERFAYSNSGYLLLSVIVQRVSDKTFRAFTDEDLFAPLGMKASHFHDRESACLAGLAVGYSTRPDGSFIGRSSSFDRVGDGGLFTCADDLFLWNKSLYDGALPHDITKVLSVPGRLDSGRSINYSLGLFIDEHEGFKTLSHRGRFPGFGAEMLRFPEKRFTIVCLCNLDEINPNLLAKNVATLFLQRQLDDKKRSIPPSKKQASAPPVPLKLKSLVGTYLDVSTGDVFSVKDYDRHIFIDGSEFLTQLTPVGKNQVRSVNVHPAISMKFETRGDQAIGVSLEVEGQNTAMLIPVVVTPSTVPSRSKEYSGRYYSDELSASYKVFPYKGQLMVQTTRNSAFGVTLILKDIYRFRKGHTVITIRFGRDKYQRVSGFKVDYGRAKGVDFIKTGNSFTVSLVKTYRFLIGLLRSKLMSATGS